MLDVGSIFVEFDIDNAQILPGGKQGWCIVYGPNSVHGRSAVRKGKIVMALPAVQNIIVTEIK
jgi:hypothetical protein